MISIILALAFVGFLIWLLLQVPMPPFFKNLIIGITCFATVIWLLQSFGLLHGVWIPRL